LKRTLFVLAFGIEIFVFQSITFAQNDALNNADLGEVSDTFQELFFESLKQKGIENYELALAALHKAENETNDPQALASVQFEIGKNHLKLKDFENAEQALKKSLSATTDKEDILEVLYDVYYEDKNYPEAINLVKQLMEYDPVYKEDLANLYSRTKQYSKALEVLDEIDQTLGESPYRNALRTQIYRRTGNKKSEISKLEDRVSSNSKTEQDFLNLIYLYSEQGNVSKAFDTAKTLLQKFPNSKLVHLALYKFYLNEGNYKEAENSMTVVFTSQEISPDSKYSVLSDFLNYVNQNPDVSPEFEKMLSVFSTHANSKIFEQLGDYFSDKKEYDRAVHFYKLGLKDSEDNYSLIVKTVQLQIALANFQEAFEVSENALEIFPSQANLYYLHGKAATALHKYAIAESHLEMALDFIIENSDLEKEVYVALVELYTVQDKQNLARKYQQIIDEKSNVNH